MVAERFKTYISQDSTSENMTAVDMELLEA